MPPPPQAPPGQRPDISRDTIDPQRLKRLLARIRALGLDSERVQRELGIEDLRQLTFAQCRDLEKEGLHQIVEKQLAAPAPAADVARLKDYAARHGIHLPVPPAATGAQLKKLWKRAKRLATAEAQRRHDARPQDVRERERRELASHFAREERAGRSPTRGT